MERPSKHDVFMDMARSLATRTTCSRRGVGCILVNELGHIIATGYNGVAAGSPHCIDEPCPGASCPSGTGLDKCWTIHAEQNAIMQCSNVQEIYAAYITCSPCIHCAKLLMNTGVKLIYFPEVYDHEALTMLRSVGIKTISTMKPFVESDTTHDH